MPTVDLGPDLNINIGDTVELWPQTDAFDFQWFNGSEEDHLILIADEIGTGTIDVWLKVTGLDSCFNADTILVTINQATWIPSEDNSVNVKIYPNPVDEGFYLKIPKDEIVGHISIYNQTGQVIQNHIPHTYPYFNVSKLLPGSYVLKIHLRESVVFLKFIKL